MDRNDVVKFLNNRIVAVASVNSSGSKTLRFFARVARVDGNVIWIRFRASERNLRKIERNPNVCLLFSSKIRNMSVSVYGTAQAVSEGGVSSRCKIAVACDYANFYANGATGRVDF